MMNLELKKALLLDYLLELPSSFYLLTRENSGEIFNKPDLNLRMTSLKEQLVFLEDNGYISFSENQIIKSLTVDQITDYTVLALTQKGGEVWERVFMPNWHRYVSWSSTEDGQHEITSLNQARIEKIKNCLEYLAIENIEFKPIKHWEVFYWKSFENAYQLYVAQTDAINELLPELIFKNWRIEWSSLMDAEKLTSESELFF